MLIIKVVFLYIFLFLGLFYAVLESALTSPALVFYVPSMSAMIFYGKVKLANPKANTFKLSLCSAFTFSILTVLLSFLLQLRFNWLENSSILYFVAFGGNFLFPFMIFPRIKSAQNLKFP